MTKIDDKNLKQISGAGGNQNVAPGLGTSGSQGSETEDDKIVDGGSIDLEEEEDNYGGTQNVQM